jgi:hypothetical protein
VEPTVTKTFRLSREISNAMTEESRRASVSENVVVNQVLKRWAVFDRFVARQNIMMLNRRLFTRFSQILDENDLEEIAKEFGKKLTVDLFDLNGMEMTRGNVLDYYLKTVLSDCMRWYSYEHHGDHSQGRFVLRHDFGRRWSVFLKTFIETMLHGCFDLKTSFRISEDAVFFTYSF